MCGIVGYVGHREACQVLIDGLRRLEYRGYDSAGVAVLDGGLITVRKAVGKLKVLESILADGSPPGAVGVGHTRWATHGRPSDENAHPHSDCGGRVVVVHNGIIENYHALKEQLISEGHEFKSETDTEVVAHLVERYCRGSDRSGRLADAVREAVKHLEGSFALAVMSRDDPGTVIAARRHSPLIVGVGDGENFVASDVPAFLPYTKKVHFIDNDTLVVMKRDSVSLFTFCGEPVHNDLFEITWDAGMAERGGYEHFMLKEIDEQPQALRQTMLERLSSQDSHVNLPGIGLSKWDIRKIEKIVMIACGTAYHASMVGKYAIESLCRIPVEIDVASEFRYRDPIIDDRTLAMVISQSGETADTLAGLREARSKGAGILAITNVVGSSVARESDGVLYTYAGPEIAVASTKAYTTQLMMLYLIALYFAQVRETIAEKRAEKLRRALWAIPQQVDLVLQDPSDVLECAERYCSSAGFLYIGRGANLATALEGALKIKEIAYIHAEGYAAGEMKHGPIAMIDSTMATVAAAVRGRTYDKVLSNIQEIKAREGQIIAVAYQHDDGIARFANHVIRIPETEELLSPIPAAVPLQLLAYHVARLRGHEIDQPRNLAKSVTVE